MFYALATNHDFWKNKINLFVALAPVVNLANTDSKMLKFLAKLDSVLHSVVMIFGKHELFPRSNEKKFLKKDGFWCKLIPGCALSL